VQFVEFKDRVVEVEVGSISSWLFPFHHSLDVQALAEDIRGRGLLQPICVRPIGNGGFQGVFGRRRVEAYREIGWEKIPAFVRRLDDAAAFLTALQENLQRENLNPMEEGKAYRAYVEQRGWGGVTKLASEIGRSQSYVTRRIQLAERLSPRIVAYDGISVSHAEELIRLPTYKQELLAQQIVERELTVRETSRAVEFMRRVKRRGGSIASEEVKRIVNVAIAERRIESETVVGSLASRTAAATSRVRLGPREIVKKVTEQIDRSLVRLKKEPLAGGNELLDRWMALSIMFYLVAKGVAVCPRCGRSDSLEWACCGVKMEDAEKILGSAMRRQRT